MIDFLKDLNPPQREAVSYINGPLLILAGAGSGKTRVLAYRLAYMIGVGKISPDKMLAVTFTNKAAEEMRSRVETLVGKTSFPVWTSTFHSLCSKILRKEAGLLGYKTNFVIYDEDNSLSLIKRCMEELNISSKTFSAQAILSRISGAKNELVDWRSYSPSAEDFFERHVARVYQLYQEKLEQSSAFDFDDLIMKMAKLFEKNPEVLKKYQNRFQYILVDEYQDTNHAQYVLVKQLSSVHRNLCVVGDDDQSIYGWRGADLNNILDFEKDYPDCKVIRLEQNYRSTQVILDAASSVVTNNLGRKGKTLWTDKKGGDKICLHLVEDENYEALICVQKIKNLLEKTNLISKDFVILYRTNAQSRILEQKLRDAGIPYIIVGGVRFYQRKEVKDILAYLKVVSNLDDVLNLRRIINVPSRGIGDKTLSKLEDFALENKTSFFEALKEVEKISDIPQRMQNQINDFYRMMNEFIRAKNQLPIDKLTKLIIEKTGYLDELRKEKTIEAESRAENVLELVTAVEEFKQRAKTPSLEPFLEEVSLLADVDYWDETKDRVSLMTLHSAKGLEFPVVFITGLEEGLFPISRSLESSRETEEERRLFYVGLTRAKEKVFLSYCHHRKRFGDMVNLKSRFLDEIPENLIEVEDFLQKGWEEKGIEKIEKGKEDYFEDSLLKVGTRVLHPHFGEGKVIKKEGLGENTRVEVQFKTGFIKRLMVKYADLEIIGY
jgi:DNA helicase-2/ATP-dependent DNA helicase PcrA